MSQKFNSTSNPVVDGEYVLCVPRSALEALGGLNGVTTDVERLIPILSDPNLAFYRRCDELENNPDLLQIIPCHAIVRDGKFLAYHRTKQSGEQRLQGKLSVAIGGHINTDDCGTALTIALSEGAMPRYCLHAIYNTGAARELSEELIMAGKIQSHTIEGFIHLPEDPVGQVHLGVIHSIRLEDMGGVGSKDPSLDLWGFQDSQTVLACERLEGWGRAILSHPDLPYNLRNSYSKINFPLPITPSSNENS